MKLTIDINVLKKYKVTLGQFLVLLLGYYDYDYEALAEEMIRDGTIDANVFNKGKIILSDNIKNLITGILVESNEKATNSGIDFDDLANKLRNIYPKGCKPGTSYNWRGTKEEISRKLRTLVVSYDFTFTEEEAISAVKEYIDSFDDVKHMQLLKHFILKTIRKGKDSEATSQFMTIIENNREINTQNGDIGDLEDALG